ncbi:MAG: LA2681 family HEPN domain-containing protein, partial [Verrucomicrobiota bacterium]|nr:LA2681 family HEPN domain-containing protein [Verrucomicrobiota bacterium]
MDIKACDLDDVLTVTTLAGMHSGSAAEFVGNAVDNAWAAQRADVLRHLVGLAATVDRAKATETNVTLLDYYLGNLWNGLKCLVGPHRSGSWQWDSAELEFEIICLRRAIRSKGFGQIPNVRRCQILTNLANCHSTTGRFVEAIGAWNQAIAIEPRFGMARGNRAAGRWSYAKAVYDEGHAIVMAREAWRDLDPSTLEALEPGAREYFAAMREEIEVALPAEALKATLDLADFPLGATDAEVDYRRWCLANRLFLNPLNDLGAYAIGARDILTSPSIVAPIGEGPRFHGFFNQIKQEFCSARWLAYEAMTSAAPHFSDADVVLYNTLDYPSYSLATEKLKLAFRACYSLLDKIAFLLNAYLRLAIPEKRVSFRGLWYDAQEKKKGVRQEFRTLPNWPLRGLYWLGKDLYEDAPEFRAGIDPDAERLSEIRNHLEHKYFKLHLEMWHGDDSAT